MSIDTEKEFEDIANEAISSAEGVSCSFGSFVEGLKHIIATLKERLAMAEDELQSHDGSDESEDDDE